MAKLSLATMSFFWWAHQYKFGKKSRIGQYISVLAIKILQVEVYVDII